MKHVSSITKTKPAMAAGSTLSGFFAKIRDLFNGIFGGIFGTPA